MKSITDGNSSVCKISYLVSEYCSVYPITPASTIGEKFSIKSENGDKNIFNNIPKVDVMQSELGAISVANGALNSGLYSTTFTSSQGLLLMIPNMYKMSSSLKPFVLTVPARSLSSHALSIFGDHSDIYATKQTGFTMLCSSNNQKIEDFSMIANMLTLKSKIPVLHFYDGFISSHKTDTIDALTEDNVKNLFPYESFYEFKKSALLSTNPKRLGTNQNPDIFFQNRERINEYTNAIIDILNECFDDFYKETGRKYGIFEYFGSPTASKILVCMASAVEVCKECLNYLSDDYGLVCVNLFNPFSSEEFLKVLPKTTKIITVLDRAKENGSIYESLASSVLACIENKDIKLLAGRYGLGGKNFDLSMAKACFLNMNAQQKNHFTIGINDDITHTSLEYDKENFDCDYTKLGIFGLGNDGSVSSSKLALKIIGNNTDYFVSGNSYYDSKKSGNLTESQLFISKQKQNINYKVNKFNYLLINNALLIDKYKLYDKIEKNATILINANNVDSLNNNFKFEVAKNNAKLYYINADEIAEKNNLKNKINLIMLASFIKIIEFIDYPVFVNNLKKESAKLYSISTDYLNDVENEIKRCIYPKNWKELSATQIQLNNYELISKNLGDSIPVSFFKANGEDGLENYNNAVSNKKASWDPQKCIMCGNCALTCPHSALHIKKVTEEELKNAPKDFKYIKCKDNSYFCLNIDTSRCTGCAHCVLSCPVKALILENDNKDNTEFFRSLKNEIDIYDIKNINFNNEYYSCNTACNGCAEIGYFKLLSSMFGSHLVLSNATGCSSIYNGTVACSPFNKDAEGFGTSFISNLFEDGCEFGMGVTKGYQINRENLINYIKENFENFSIEFKELLNKFLQNINNFSICKEIYLKINETSTKNSYDDYVKNLSPYLINTVHFITGGDGFAYDIDFSGLEQVVATNQNVNILILDNELYSNTGGQTSKASGYGSKTKYTNKKLLKKKDLFLSLMQYDNLYFANICLNANKSHSIKCIKDAVNHNGPSIICAYSPCLNHKIKTSLFEQSVLAVKSGYFNLFSYNNGILNLESQPNFNLLENFLQNEGRYTNLTKEDCEYIINDKTSSYELYLKLKEVLKK